jgi:FkbH-like protein
MYREESVRKGLETNFDGDYIGFLRDCEITLSIRPLNVETLKRVHELSQRTNQMNFSGTRYDRDVLERILGDAAIDTYVLDCADRFGNYGTIGFCVVDAREPRMTDLMFSCRVQSKRVEHAFLAFLIDRYRSGGFAAFHVDYRRTKHNAPSGKVFDDLGFDTVASVDGVTSLVFPAGRELPHDGVIQLDIHERYRTCTGASSDS